MIFRVATALTRCIGSFLLPTVGTLFLYSPVLPCGMCYVRCRMCDVCDV
jgi:hypothetical protein